jgi:hypothetical protein
MDIMKASWLLAILMMLLLILNCDEPGGPTTPRVVPATWERYWTVYYGTSDWLTQVVFVSDSEAWIINEKKLIHFVNGEFIKVEVSPPQFDNDVNIERISFCDPSYGWAIYRKGDLYQYENGIWTKSPRIDNTVDTVLLHDIYAISTNDIWISGSYFTRTQLTWHQCLWHFDGSNWTRTDMPLPEVEWLKFKNSNDGYMTYSDMGNSGGVYHWDGQNWTQVLWGNTPCGVGFDNAGNNFVGSLYTDMWIPYGLSRIMPGNMLGESVVSSFQMRFEDIQNNSTGDICAIGYDRPDRSANIVMHWNGQYWFYLATEPQAFSFQSLDVTERGDVWATFRVEGIEEERSYLAKLNLDFP